MALQLSCKVTLPACGSGLAYTLYLYLNLLKYISIVHPSTHFLSQFRDKTSTGTFVGIKLKLNDRVVIYWDKGVEICDIKLVMGRCSFFIRFRMLR